MKPPPSFVLQPEKYARFGSLGRVCRLGLATRGNTYLDPEDVLHAIDCGVNYFNWCAHPDGMSDAISQLGAKRKEIIIAAQLYAHTADCALREIAGYLAEMRTDYLDVLTFYYLENENEWETILSKNGAMTMLEELKSVKVLRAVGVTSHQRLLAAKLAQYDQLDCLMIRYNAAHRGAEEEVFPVTEQQRLPVISYTGLRWGALLKPTPEDPPGFRPPPAPDWYRFTLCHPSVTVSLMAPNGRAELEENLKVLDDWHGLSRKEYGKLRDHGSRVQRHVRLFP